VGSSKEFMEYVAGQIEEAGEITYRKMFGEYGVYCDGRIFALVCDDQLFIKPTEAGRKFIGEPVEAPPYPGARMYFRIDDQIEDVDWLSELVRVTVKELPPPRPKKKKK